VGVVKSHTEGPKEYAVPVPTSDIGKQYGQLLESKKGTDVTFEVDGEIFAAHKLVLAARSPVFRAQLFGPMKEKNMQGIKVDDMEAPVFKVLVPFISLFVPYHSFCMLMGMHAFPAYPLPEIALFLSCCCSSIAYFS